MKSRYLLCCLALALSACSGANPEAKFATALLINDSLAPVSCAFHKKHGRWPATNAELLSAVNDARRKNGVAELAALLDGWKRPLIYRFPGTVHPDGYDLVSLGEDGVLSADDILNRDCPVDWPRKVDASHL